MNKYISENSHPVTGKVLTDDLRKLGVRQGDTLFVHCSMRSLGFVAGFTETVVRALINVVGESGTIVMPGHSADNSNPEDWQNPPVPESWIETLKRTIPPFDPRTTPTRYVGQLPEYFRSYPEVKRSHHPQTSFLAFGRHSKTITEEHPLEWSLSDGSPLGKMTALNTKILMLGTDYESCTAMHLAEYRSHFRETVLNEASVLINGERQWVKYQDIALDTELFNDIGAAFESSNMAAFTKGNVGYAASKLIEMNALIDFTTRYLEMRK